jgi:rSAM/selenodomain-associated transferase 1
MRPATLLIYAKPPRMGVSKTRLAKGLGPTAARRIAHFTLSRTVRAAMAQRGWVTHLYTAPDASLQESLGGIWPQHLERRSQGMGDLTARLELGLREAPNGPVIFIGADAPDLSIALLRKAVRALNRADAVFGPASDGGFWLFGMNKTARSPSPFGGVRWSGPHAMEDVWSRLPKTARVTQLPTLIDIDEAEDWETWRAEPRRNA